MNAIEAEKLIIKLTESTELGDPNGVDQLRRMGEE
jgi:hypothetical protein